MKKRRKVNGVMYPRPVRLERDGKTVACANCGRTAFRREKAEIVCDHCDEIIGKWIIEPEPSTELQ